jgi:proteasome lid subunit RPN8/RPN11
LVFDIKEYPTTAPAVFTDRLNFPKTKLAHLYIAVNGKPPGFCYVKGNKDDWYSNKRIKDVLIRIGNWLRDAATGELTQNGDQFEPLRLEGYSGTIVYDYNTFVEIVNTKNSLPDIPLSWALFEQSQDGSSTSFIFSKIVTAENIADVLKDIELDKAKSDNATNKKNYHSGFILWSNSTNAFGNYEINFPKTWLEFKDFCNRHEVDWTGLEYFNAHYKVNHFIEFPVVVAIKRPTTLIGYSANIEFVNLKFRVQYSNDVEDDKFITDFPIELLSHNQPLTQSLSRRISDTGTVMHSMNIVYGVGALGSKIIMHFARLGLTNFFIVDPDELSPHNLTRHALLADSVGSNKAKAIVNAIKKIYPTEQVNSLNLYSSQANEIQSKGGFSKFDWCLDFTASEAHFNKLAVSDKIEGPVVISGSISDFGNLGILYKEGENRNPRIDDLRASLYSMSKSNKQIRAWLLRENQSKISENLLVNVGVGCNSETTILSDIKVSSHGSYFSGVIHSEIKNKNSNGKIFLNIITENPNYSTETNTITIQPYDVFFAINDSTWQVRFRKDIIDDIKKQFRKAKPRETGGVFIGIVNYKNKTIHVTDLILAPADSRANGFCFIRGIHGLPKRISEVVLESGQQLGYIGEWHTHPHGPDNLSDIDLASVARFKEEFDQLPTPLPVFITIVTPMGVRPFVF